MLFVLSFQNSADRTPHRKYYLPTVEIKHYAVAMDKTYLINQLKMTQKYVITF